jgi:hypothetical protein
MLIAATAIFVYYTVWTLFMVRLPALPLPDTLAGASLNRYTNVSSPSSTRTTSCTRSSSPASGPSASP